MRKNIYIPEDKEHIWLKLEKHAEEIDRSVSYLVNEVIKNYLRENTDHLSSKDDNNE